MGLKDMISLLGSKEPLSERLEKVQADVLFALIVAATKTDTLSPVLSSITWAAAMKLTDFSAGEVIRLLLAATKAKGQPISDSSKRKLFERAGEILQPSLSSLPIVEIIKVGFAASGEPGK